MQKRGTRILGNLISRPRMHPHLRLRPISNLLARTPYRPQDHLEQLLQTSPEALRRPAAARLWNPTNSTPRSPPPTTSYAQRRRRPSTPPPPNVPLHYPVIDVTPDPNDPAGSATGDCPLLNKSEQRHSRHSVSARASLQFEGRLSGDQRASLPKSLRQSYDGKRASNPPPPEQVEAGPSEPRPRTDSESKTKSLRQRGQSVTSRARAISFGLVRPDKTGGFSARADKGKGKAVMAPAPEHEDPARSFSQDLERGPDPHGHRLSHDNLSIPGGLGSPVSSSDSSIMGDPDQPDVGEEWGPQHPCFPHMNPHVPINSPEYAATRIIRIKRDWLVEGDLAPTFSNLYPEILDPAGVSEQEFRRIIEKLNGELVPAFNAYHWRNILDGTLGLLTGWIWDDMGFTFTKSKLSTLEGWIEKWNLEMEKTIGSEDSILAPKIVPLRRTGYMNLDIQIPDPEIAPAATASEPNSRAGPIAEPEPAVVAEHVGETQ